MLFYEDIEPEAVRQGGGGTHAGVLFLCDIYIYIYHINDLYTYRNTHMIYDIYTYKNTCYALTYLKPYGWGGGHKQVFCIYIYDIGS